MLELAGLATGNKIGVAVVAAVFISFALVSSFVAPRRWADFPGRNGLSVFVIASFLLFGAMLTAIAVLAVESEHGGEAQAAATEGQSAKQTIQVHETEFKIALPTLSGLKGGEYSFVVHNDGQIQHDLVVEGPGVTGTAHTPLLAPGASATLTVKLGAGSYTLYCSVAGHRQAGMSTKLTVG